MTSSSKSSSLSYHGREQDHFGTVIYYNFADTDDHREVVQLTPDDFDDISVIDPESVPTSPSGIPPVLRGDPPDQHPKKDANQEPLLEPGTSSRPEKRTSSTSSTTPSAVPPGLHDHGSTSPGVTQLPQPTPVTSDSSVPDVGSGLPQLGQFENTNFGATLAVLRQLPSPSSA